MSAAASTGQPVSPAAVKPDEASADDSEEKRWQPVMGLPCDLTVDLNLPEFKVRDLLKLGPGTVLGSTWPVRQDVPLRVNGNVVGWSEFEVVGENLAVRLTELA